MVKEIIKDKIYLIHNFFDNNDCQEIIKFIDSRSDIKNSLKSMCNYIVNDIRIINIYKNHAHKLPIMLEPLEQVTLGYTYNGSNGIGLHIDNPSTHKEAKYKLLVYLNNNFEGGFTKFYYEKKSISMHPKTGTAVLFDISLPHKGTPVSGNDKYTVGFRFK